MKKIYEPEDLKQLIVEKEGCSVEDIDVHGEEGYIVNMGKSTT